MPSGEQVPTTSTTSVGILGAGPEPGEPTGEPSYMTIRMGDSVISVMQPQEGGPTRSAFYVYVPNVDAVHERAVKAGARSIQEPTDVVHGDPTRRLMMGCSPATTSIGRGPTARR